MAHKQREKWQHSMPITEEDIMRQAQDIWNCDVGKKRSSCLKMMISEPISVVVWVVPLTVGMLRRTDLVPAGGTFEHLLWTLMFMWTKPLCSLAGGINPETFWTWTWASIDAIASLEPLVVSLSLLRLLQNLFFLPSENEFQIIWENCFKKGKGNDCLTTCDSTDFWIAEQGKAFYSHKFKKSGLQYEVCLCILTGDIGWVNGPYECGLCCRILGLTALNSLLQYIS